jgi:hypothetical protein
MRQIYGGAVALFAGIAVFIVAARHRRTPGAEFMSNFSEHRTHPRGWSGTVEDLVHGGGWALVIAGLVLLIMGLIAYSAAVRRPA